MAVQLTIKPSFFWKVFLWSRFIQICFYALWFSLALAFMLGFGGTKNWWPGPFIFSAALCIPGSFLSAALIGRRTYRNTEYRITPERIEIETGSLVRQTRIFHFSDLDYVLLEQNALQRKCGIASLALISRTTPVVRLGWVQDLVTRAHVASAPRLVDVPNPEKLLELLNERRERALN